MRIGPDDVFIGLSFPRYSKRTVQASHFARANGAKVIAITDSQKSPLADVADHVLIARSDMVSFIDSLVAPLSLVNALIDRNAGGSACPYGLLPSYKGAGCFVYDRYRKNPSVHALS